MAEQAVGALVPRAAALARPDGSVLLVCADPGTATSRVVEALVGHGLVALTGDTTALDPTTLEVRLPVEVATRADVPREPLEVRLLVVPQRDEATIGVRATRLSGAEAALLVGLRSVGLDQVAGGPLPALARLARRVPAYQVSYADHRLAAEEVVRLWPSP